jgi:hypothetical protein
VRLHPLLCILEFKHGYIGIIKCQSIRVSFYFSVEVNQLSLDGFILLIDGNFFTPYSYVGFLMGA